MLATDSLSAYLRKRDETILEELQYIRQELSLQKQSLAHLAALVHSIKTNGQDE